MRLRCGNCGFVRELTVSDQQAREYDRGIRRIRCTLARLERSRMLEEADALATALERDLIDASDFAR